MMYTVFRASVCPPKVFEEFGFQSGFSQIPVRLFSNDFHVKFMSKLNIWTNVRLVIHGVHVRVSMVCS